LYTLRDRKLTITTIIGLGGGRSCLWALMEVTGLPACPFLQSVFTLGAAAGGLSAMVLSDLLGRKLSIMSSAVPSAAGYALMAGAHGLWMLLLGRMLTGFAGGLTAACIPVRPGCPPLPLCCAGPPLLQASAQ
jgi:MFS family permease